MQDRRFVALDCETTGLEASKDKIIEVGATSFGLDEDGDTFDELYDPGVRIPALVERLTGIQSSDLTGKPKFIDKLPELAKFTEGAILIGHNLRFDTGFLASHGLDRTENPNFDTYDLAGLVLPKVTSMSLIALATRLNCIHEKAHRALSDAEATRDLFRALVREGQKFPQEKWESILNLKVTKKNWLQQFAKLVLNARDVRHTQNIGNKDLDKSIPTDRQKNSKPEANTKLAAELTKLLTTGKPTLLESSVVAEEVISAISTSNPEPRTYNLIVTASSFEASELAGEYNLPLVLAPHFYPDSEKLEKFIQRELTPIEAAFAAKLLLHRGLNFFELNLTRTERLLWDFIAAEKLPDIAENQKILVTHHASLPAVASNLKPKQTIVLTTTALPSTLARREAVTLDLPALETLLPGYEERLTIWWGLLGQLLQQAEPLYGRINLGETTGLPGYAKTIIAGQNLLVETRDYLPPKLVTALEKYLGGEPSYSRVLRTDSGGNLTISLDPAPDPTALGRLAGELGSVVFLDGALSTGNHDFSFIKRQLGLPVETPTASLQPASNQIELVAIPSLPAPNEKNFVVASEQKLLELINTLPGITVVQFNGRYALGQFYEKTHTGATHSVYGDKVSGSLGKNFLGLSKEKDAAYLTTSTQLPPHTQNLILVKLPFTVRDGADWATETLPAATLTFKRSWLALANVKDRPASQQFICLDNRLTEKGYGKDFQKAVGAIPVKF